jgi:hypothetical protein
MAAQQPEWLDLKVHKHQQRPHYCLLLWLLLGDFLDAESWLDESHPADSALSWAEAPQLTVSAECASHWAQLHQLCNDAWSYRVRWQQLHEAAVC